ncbi:hypothetical protein QBS63_18395 [Cronobacter sakazakii]|nr:hypothetical protein [Cronobacter sakazakii]MDQ9195446.1 hypothetical protein [Cronobacter sakazakii]
MKRIACVACLDPKFSVHAHTFLRAVVLARHGQLVKEAQIRLFDDGGSREGALRAAREIASWGGGRCRRALCLFRGGGRRA